MYEVHKRSDLISCSYQPGTLPYHSPTSTITILWVGYNGEWVDLVNRQWNVVCLGPTHPQAKHSPSFAKSQRIATPVSEPKSKSF